MKRGLGKVNNETGHFEAMKTYKLETPVKPESEARPEKLAKIRAKNNEWRKFWFIQNNTPSRFYDLAQERQAFEKNLRDKQQVKAEVQASQKKMQDMRTKQREAMENKKEMDIWESDIQMKHDQKKKQQQVLRMSYEASIAKKGGFRNRNFRVSENRNDMVPPKLPEFNLGRFSKPNASISYENQSSNNRTLSETPSSRPYGRVEGFPTPSHYGMRTPSPQPPVAMTPTPPKVAPLTQMAQSNRSFEIMRKPPPISNSRPRFGNQLSPPSQQFYIPAPPINLNDRRVQRGEGFKSTLGLIC